MQSNLSPVLAIAQSRVEKAGWPPGRIPVEAFFINKKLREGLQVQLTSAIVEVLLEAQAEPGTKIPSSRELAAHLGISRLTVAHVYQELLAQGCTTVKTVWLRTSDEPIPDPFVMR